MSVTMFMLVMHLLVMPAIATAEIYRWVDSEGHTQFGDRPPVNGGAKRIEVDVNSYESVTIQPFEAYSSKSVKSSGVVMYSTTWCGVCKRARRYFQARKIPFKEYDIEKTRKGKRDYARLQGRGVPIILVDGKRMSGFSASRFQRMYDARQQ